MWASGAWRTRRPHLVRSDRASRSGTRGNPQRKVYSEPGPRDRALMPLTYPFTRSYRLAYRHYLLSLTGYVKPEDEPNNLLKASIARMKASIAEERKARKAREALEE